MGLSPKLRLTCSKLETIFLLMTLLLPMRDSRLSAARLARPISSNIVGICIVRQKDNFRSKLSRLAARSRIQTNTRKQKTAKNRKKWNPRTACGQHGRLYHLIFRTFSTIPDLAKSANIPECTISVAPSKNRRPTEKSICHTSSSRGLPTLRSTFQQICFLGRKFGQSHFGQSQEMGQECHAFLRDRESIGD